MDIVDTHTHVPGRLFGGRLPVDIARLREEFEKAGVRCTWIFTVDGLLSDPCWHNDVLAETLKDHRDFFVPFCTVSPHHDVDAIFREMERAKTELGMRGLKLHSWLQAFSMSHPAVMPIFQKAAELEFPILLHDGTPPYSTPLQIAAVAERVPQATIILGHAGLDDLVGDAILACLRHKNIYLSLTSLSVGSMRDVIMNCPSERLFFGSDGGLLPGLVDMAVQKLLATEVSISSFEQICFENPTRIISLPEGPVSV